MERMAKRDKQRRGVCGFVTRNLQLDGWMGSIRQSNGDEWQFLSLTRTLSFPNVDVLVYGARNRTNSSIRCETKVARFRWIGNNASFKTLLPLLSVNKTERGVGEGGGGGGERERERERSRSKKDSQRANQRHWHWIIDFTLGTRNEIERRKRYLQIALSIHRFYHTWPINQTFLSFCTFLAVECS